MDISSKVTARLTADADFSTMPEVDLDLKAQELHNAGYKILAIDHEARTIRLYEQEDEWPARS